MQQNRASHLGDSETTFQNHERRWFLVMVSCAIMHIGNPSVVLHLSMTAISAFPDNRQWSKQQHTCSSQSREGLLRTMGRALIP